MPFDEALARRVRKAVGPRSGVSEKKMFGGLAFLLNGRMFCGIVHNDLMVRIGPERYTASLTVPHVRPMDFNGRPMRGYVFVGAAGCGTQRDVNAWVRRGIDFAERLADNEM